MNRTEKLREKLIELFEAERRYEERVLERTELVLEDRDNPRIEELALSISGLEEKRSRLMRDIGYHFSNAVRNGQFLDVPAEYLWEPTGE